MAAQRHLFHHEDALTTGPRQLRFSAQPIARLAVRALDDRSGAGAEALSRSGGCRPMLPLLNARRATTPQRAVFAA